MSDLSALLDDLLAAASTALIDAGQSAAHEVIVLGDVAWDDRCGGYLYVRLAGSVPLGGNHRCAVPLVSHTIYVGVLRCVEVVSDDGTPPSTQTITNEAMIGIADQGALRKMLTCDFDWAPYGNDKKFIGWSPLGPDGGYAGGEWQIEVRLIPDCGC